MGLIQHVCQMWPIRLWYSYPAVALVVQRIMTVLFCSLVLGLVTLNCGGNAIQEAFIVVRRACTCDLVNLVAKCPGGELLSVVLTPSLQNRLSYWYCRIVCGCLP